MPKKRRKRKHHGDELLHPSDGWESRVETAEAYLLPTADQAEQMEWEALGLNVYRHPLAQHRTALRDLGVTSSKAVWNLPHGTHTRVAGLLECMQRPPTKSGRPVYFLMIEDEDGLLQTTMFRPTYERFGHILHQKSAYLLEGRVEQDDRRGFSFLVEAVRDLAPLLSATGTAPTNTVAAAPTVPDPAVPASGAFVRAGRRARRGQRGRSNRRAG